jgi:hypothetical protein
MSKRESWEILTHKKLVEREKVSMTTETKGLEIRDKYKHAF